MNSNSAQNKAQLGVIGLRVMGSNLALNVESRGHTVAVWNRNSQLMHDFVAEHSGKQFIGAESLEDFCASLERPRRVLLMIQAGAAVDSVIEQLCPLLDRGDIVIDGGNSWFLDSQRREALLRERGLHFVGLGVSGGEEGARFGPSLMPGCSEEAYAALGPILESIAAVTESGPCVTHVGAGGAGHFVKMVHNGIEYADMQLIAEAYDALQRLGGMGASQLAEVFAEWNKGPLESFLIEISASIFKVTDAQTGLPLVDMVEDRAGQKGTGRWTASIALELGVAVPSIAAAVDARVLSSQLEARKELAQVFGEAEEGVAAESNLADQVRDALFAAKICAYAQGLQLIQAGAEDNDWKVDLSEIARIWKGGCIIRARLLDEIRAAFERNPALSNLIQDAGFRSQLSASIGALRSVVALAQSHGIPVPAMSASLSWFDSVRRARLPQNLTQAQRDAFGAHGYVRLDSPDGEPVHSQWL